MQKINDKFQSNKSNYTQYKFQCKENEKIDFNQDVIKSCKIQLKEIIHQKIPCIQDNNGWIHQ